MQTILDADICSFKPSLYNIRRFTGHIRIIDLKLKAKRKSNLMNVLRISVICTISLITVTSGFSGVRLSNFAVSKALIDAFTAENMALKETNLQQQATHWSISSYEPPPDIGGPKRTSGSGGRYC